jgi:hypothetical protein
MPTLDDERRDLPNAAAVDVLQRALNPHGATQFETIARSGIGVFDALKACPRSMLEHAKSWSAAHPYR